MSASSLQTRKRNTRNLIIATAMLTLVWGWLLPMLANQPQIQARLKFLDHHGIDPSAMFYTELDAMAPILERIESDHR